MNDHQRKPASRPSQQKTDCAENPPVISVYGLGYSGLAIAAVLLEAKNKVIGFDESPRTASRALCGSFHASDRTLNSALMTASEDGTFQITSSATYAAIHSNASFICAPSRVDRFGTLDNSIVQEYCGQVAAGLKHADTADGTRLIIIQSILPPGYCDNTLLPMIERLSGQENGQGFELCHMPVAISPRLSLLSLKTASKVLLGCASSQRAEALLSKFRIPRESIDFTDHFSSERSGVTNAIQNSPREDFAVSRRKLIERYSCEIEPQAKKQLFVNQSATSGGTSRVF